MIPNTDHALRNLSQRLLTSLLPELGSEYAMADGMLLGMLMNAVADELAEGIERRLTDIKEMKELLGQCELTADERPVLDRELPDYSLKSVNARHDELTRILIRCHEQVEADSSLEALNRAIWQYLWRHSNRHAITAADV